MKLISVKSHQTRVKSRVHIQFHDIVNEKVWKQLRLKLYYNAWYDDRRNVVDAGIFEIITNEFDQIENAIRESIKQEYTEH
jgi:hypothetical protein